MSSCTIKIRRQLVTQGWAVFESASDRDTRATLREFGELLSRQRIAQEPDARVQRVEDESLRVCSGDPGIRWICWHAVSPDPQGAAILLNPVWLPVLELREETKVALRELTMGVPARRGADAQPCPILRKLPPQGLSPSCEAIFFRPWLWREGANESLDLLVSKLKAQGNDRVRLRPGQALLVDNARVLHGFEPVDDPRQTLLIRHQLWGFGADTPPDEWD